MVKIDIDTSQLRKKLKAIQKEMSDLRGLWNRLEPGIQSWSERTFQTDGFGTWEPTSRPNPILRDTRRYFKSFTETTSDTVDIKDPMSWEFGSSVPYGQYHEFGTGKLPVRAVSGALADQREFHAWISQEADKYFEEVLNRAAQ